MQDGGPSNRRPETGTALQVQAVARRLMAGSPISGTTNFLNPIGATRPMPGTPSARCSRTVLPPRWPTGNECHAVSNGLNALSTLVQNPQHLRQEPSLCGSRAPEPRKGSRHPAPGTSETDVFSFRKYVHKSTVPRPACPLPPRYLRPSLRDLPQPVGGPGPESRRRGVHHGAATGRGQLPLL